ncbi:MAG: hypothetical protein ACKPKO_09490, partial [Candidatus Fonsibacter sp.]
MRQHVCRSAREGGMSAVVIDYETEVEDIEEEWHAEESAGWSLEAVRKAREDAADINIRLMRAYVVCYACAFSTSCYAYMS